MDAPPPVNKLVIDYQVDANRFCAVAFAQSLPKLAVFFCAFGILLAFLVAAYVPNAIAVVTVFLAMPVAGLLNYRFSILPKAAKAYDGIHMRAEFDERGITSGYAEFHSFLAWSKIATVKRKLGHTLLFYSPTQYLTIPMSDEQFEQLQRIRSGAHLAPTWNLPTG